LRLERERNNRLRDLENEKLQARRRLEEQERRRREEYERQTLINQHAEREEILRSQLTNLNVEEEDTIYKIKQQQIEESTLYEHFVACHVEYGGVCDSEIEEQCNVLFSSAPMKFIVRKDVQVEREIQKLIERHNITIPIVHIKGSLYLVGLSKIHLEQKAEYVIAQVGGGYEKFEPYIGKNHKNIEKQLIIKMIQSKESLEWIVDALIRGQKIPSMKQTAYDSLGKAHD
jgi:hypothetical protein